VRSPQLSKAESRSLVVVVMYVMLEAKKTALSLSYVR
jgi:hypothetical protein